MPGSCRGASSRTRERRRLRRPTPSRTAGRSRCPVLAVASSCPPDPSEGGSLARGRAEARARRVMLVDDDAALRMLYRFNLEASGVEVIEASDGEAALRLLEGELPDVLLLDVMMPGLDGWRVAERLAADPRTRRLPIIFITARAEDAARARGLELGAAGYLTKPFNPVSLAAEVEKILEGIRRPGD